MNKGNSTNGLIFKYELDIENALPLFIYIYKEDEEVVAHTTMERLHEKTLEKLIPLILKSIIEQLIEINLSKEKIEEIIDEVQEKVEVLYE